MHIDFKRVTLHNFMSFGNAELIFNDEGFIRVSGINENPLDNAGSNGSGKSSLWEALVWAITGETIRGTKQVVNLYGEDGCFVDVEFYVDSKRYQLIRSKDHKVYKTSLQIFIDGQDVSGKGIRDSEKLLQQYLPDLTSSLLGSVIVLGQGLPQKFTNNTPSGRKEVLEKLSKSDFMIEDLKTRVTSRKSELTSCLREHENNLIELTTRKSVLQKQTADAESSIATLDKTQLTIDLQEEQAKRLNILEQIETSDACITQLLAKQQELQKLKSDVVTEEVQKIEEEKSKYESSTEDYKKTQTELLSSYGAIHKQILQIKNIKDVCPTCGQKLPDVHKPDTTWLEVELASYSTKIEDVKATLLSLEQTHKTILDNIKLTYVDNKKQLDKNIDDVVTRLNNEKINLNFYNMDLSDLNSKIGALEIKLAQIDTLFDQYTKIIRNNNEELSTIEDQILYNNAQKDLTQSHLEVISKFDTALKRDFRGFLLSTVITYVEQRAKHYCKLIFDTEDVTFCLDGNNIEIRYLNKAYENLSGGEKQKIDLIIQFSIRDMLSSQLGFTSNILVLDEVFDGLDALGCDRVVDMIASLSDIKNIFIVTHRKDLSLPTDKELIVVKSFNGISEIQQ